MSKKLLITGASGFVGYHLVTKAKSEGYEVHAAVRKSSKVSDISSSVDKFVYPDFGDVEHLKILFEEERYDYIIHAAAMTKAKDESDLFTVNVGYTLNLLRAAFSIGSPPKKVHFVSSLAAIGPIPYGDSLIHESTPYQPVTGYGRSKKQAEIGITDHFSSFPISVFRPTAVYGPKDKDIFILIKTLYTGLDPYIGDNPQKLSFIYVQDLAEVLIQGLQVSSDKLEFYNISDGAIYDRYDLANIFKLIAKKKPIRIHIPFRLVSWIATLSKWVYKSSSKTPVIYPERLNELTAENWGCDISKAKFELGFQPKNNLEKGLTQSLSWYKDNGWL